MSRFLFGGALVLVMLACDRTDQQIKVYRLVKAPVESASAEQPAPAGSTAAAPQIRWELPEGWAPGAQSSMRYASFMASAENGEKADISVVTFPGDGGRSWFFKMTGPNPAVEKEKPKFVKFLQSIRF